MIQTGEERRKHPRVDFQTEATVITSDGDILDGVSSNLSAGGALLKSYAPLRSGQRIFFDFLLRHQDRRLHIRGRGQVTHTAPNKGADEPPYRSGIQFLDLDTLSAATLDRLLAVNKGRAA